MFKPHQTTPEFLKKRQGQTFSSEPNFFQTSPPPQRGKLRGIPLCLPSPTSPPLHITRELSIHPQTPPAVIDREEKRRKNIASASNHSCFLSISFFRRIPLLPTFFGFFFPRLTIPLSPLPPPQINPAPLGSET